MSTLSHILKTAILAIIVFAVPMAAHPAEPPSSAKLAIQGYDPVAYFSDGRAVKGTAAFTYVWDESVYHFASAANRDRFAADPERYAPVFPGYCTAALSLGMAMVADPESWLIIDGRLYLFAGDKGRRMALERPGLVKESQANWERVRKEGPPKQVTDPM